MGCKSSIDGEDFYGPYDAQEFAKANGPKIGMTPLPSLNLVYTEEEDYTTADYAKEKGLTPNHCREPSFAKCCVQVTRFPIGSPSKVLSKCFVRRLRLPPNNLEKRTKNLFL